MEILLKKSRNYAYLDTIGAHFTIIDFFNVYMKKWQSLREEVAYSLRAFGCFRPPSIFYGGSVKPSILLLQLVVIIVSFLFEFCIGVDRGRYLRGNNKSQDQSPESRVNSRDQNLIFNMQISA